jgi:hypothetical protein
MFNILCNISFKEHLPEDGHERWPEHVEGYADYNTVCSESRRALRLWYVDLVQACIDACGHHFQHHL